MALSGQVYHPRLVSSARAVSPQLSRAESSVRPAARCLHNQSSSRFFGSWDQSLSRGRRCLRPSRLLVRAGRVAVGEKWWERSSMPNMREVSGVQQLVDELATAHTRLVMVDFFARWCGSCRALFPKLCSIAEENPDLLILKVEWDDNREICKALGIKVLPYFQFYRGAQGKVAEFSASVSKIQRIRDALAEHSTPRCDIGTIERLKEFPDVEPHLLTSPAQDSPEASRELAAAR